MPRSQREDFEGAWHHVMNRGAARAVVFREDRDRELFLDCIVEAMPRHGVEVHAYCLMGNHYHLLLQSLEGHLSSAMQMVIARFTFRVNARYAMDGPIFRGRFRSVLIDDDAQLMQTLRYIHLNPLDAKLVAVAEQWPWSSAQFCAPRCQTQGSDTAQECGAAVCPPWLRTDTLLDMFGSQNRSAAYRAFMSEGIDDATRRRTAAL